MPEHDAFIRMVLEYPDDPGPRLVYADWLEEQGDPRGPWLRFVSRVHELAEQATDPATDPGVDESFLPHKDPTLERLDAAALLRFAPTGDGRTKVWQILTDVRSKQAVAAAELVACDLLPDKWRRDLLRAAERVYQNLESGDLRYAAEAAMAAVHRSGRDQVDSFLVQQGYFYYVTQHMRWIGSRCGSWSVVNTYEGCLRGLLLKEPRPPSLHPRYIADPVQEWASPQQASTLPKQRQSSTLSKRGWGKLK